MIRLFLADDMPAVREVLRTFLQDAGRFQVVGEAGNGQEALEAIINLGPDVIILDVEMPGMSGIEVVQSLRRLGHDTPVVLCSSWTGPAESDLPCGVTECLRKPVRLESLTRAVETAAACLLHHD